MQKIIILILLLSTSIYAAEEKESHSNTNVVKSVGGEQKSNSTKTAAGKALNAVTTFMTYSHDMSTQVSDPRCENCSPSELMRVCANEICKSSGESPLKNQFIYTNENKIPPLNAEQLKKRENIAKNIRSILGLEIENALNDYGQREQFLKNKSFSTDAEAMRLLSLMTLTHFSNDSDRKQLPIELQKNAKEIESVIEEILTKNIMFFSSPREYFDIKYQGISFKEAVQKEVREMEIKEAEFLANPLLKKANFIKETIPLIRETSIYQKVKKGKEIDPTELSQLLEIRGIVSIVSDLITHKDYNKIASKINLEKVKETSLSDKVLSNVSQLAGSLRLMKSNPMLTESLVDYCANRIMNVGNYLATEDEKSSLVQTTEKLKKLFQNKIASRLSNESKGKLLQSMKNWRFHTKTQKDFDLELPIQIHNAKESISLEIKKSKNMSNQSKENLLSDTLDVLLFDNKKTSPYEYLMAAEFDGYKRVCFESTPEEYNDQALSILGSISVSGSSIKNPKIGKGVIAHEMGHILQSEFKQKHLSLESSKLYDKIAGCLEAKHSTDNYLGEDFADLISSLTLEPEDANFGCMLDNITFYQPFKAADDDNHSADTFRLFHVETVLKGKLPSSCDRFMDLTKQRKDFKNCWPHEASN